MVILSNYNQNDCSKLFTLKWILTVGSEHVKLKKKQQQTKVRPFFKSIFFWIRTLFVTIKFKSWRIIEKLHKSFWLCRYISDCIQKISNAERKIKNSFYHSNNTLSVRVKTHANVIQMKKKSITLQTEC